MSCCFEAVAVKNRAWIPRTQHTPGIPNVKHGKRGRNNYPFSHAPQAHDDYRGADEASKGIRPVEHEDPDTVRLFFGELIQRPQTSIANPEYGFVAIDRPLFQSAGEDLQLLGTYSLHARDGTHIAHTYSGYLPGIEEPVVLIWDARSRRREDGFPAIQFPFF